MRRPVNQDAYVSGEPKRSEAACPVKGMEDLETKERVDR